MATSETVGGEGGEIVMLLVALCFMLPAQIKLRQLLATKLEKTSFFSSSSPANKQTKRKKMRFSCLA